MCRAACIRDRARCSSCLLRDRGQVGCRVGDRLDAPAFRHKRRTRRWARSAPTPPASASETPSAALGFCRSQDGNLLINTKRTSDILASNLGIPPLQVIPHLVRLQLLLGEKLADRALRDPRQAGVPRCRAMLAAMTGQQPRRPEFVRVSHLLGLSGMPGTSSHAAVPALSDLWPLARPRTIVESRHDPKPACPCQATLDRLGASHQRRGPPHSTTGHPDNAARIRARAPRGSMDSVLATGQSIEARPTPSPQWVVRPPSELPPFASTCLADRRSGTASGNPRPRMESLQQIGFMLNRYLGIGYYVNALDRSNIAIAALTMNKSLGFTAAEYGLGAGAFFWSYILFQVPSNVLLARFGASADRCRALGQSSSPGHFVPARRHWLPV